MKAKLIFVYDTEDTYQSEEISVIRNAEKYKLTLWDVAQELRRELKYNDKLEEPARTALEGIQTFLYDTLNDRGISIE